MEKLSCPNRRRALTNFAGIGASLFSLLQMAPSSVTAAPVNGCISEVTIALKVSWTRSNPDRVLGTTVTSTGTAISAALGNKDFLEFMKSKSVIADTSILGWRIVYVSTDETGALFATKAGKPPVAVPEEILIMSGLSAWGDGIYGESQTYSAVHQVGMLDFSSTSITSRRLGCISGTFPAGIFKGLQFKAQGIDSTYMLGKAGRVPESTLNYRRLTSLVGASDATSAEFPWELPILEGSISVGAGALKDISAYSFTKN